MTEDIFEIANKLCCNGKEDEAIDLLSPLVEEGDILAKANLGLLLCNYYRDGEFCRLKEGEQLLLEACEAGGGISLPQSRYIVAR